jgi:hypothetical protein
MFMFKYHPLALCGKIITIVIRMQCPPIKEKGKFYPKEAPEKVRVKVLADDERNRAADAIANRLELNCSKQSAKGCR